MPSFRTRALYEVNRLLEAQTDSNAALGSLDERVDDLEGSSSDTDGIPEGATNLFYTDARARAALSAGAGISYNSGTGVISADGWTPVFKATTETRSSSATLTADSALQFAYTSGTYTVRVVAFISIANATMDYQYAVSHSTTRTPLFFSRSHMVAGAASGTGNETRQVLDTFPSSVAVTGATSGVAMVELYFAFETTFSGTCSFQWAQNTSDAGNISCLAGSYLEYRKVA